MPRRACFARRLHDGSNQSRVGLDRRLSCPASDRDRAGTYVARRVSLDGRGQARPAHRQAGLRFRRAVQRYRTGPGAGPRSAAGPASSRIRPSSPRSAMCWQPAAPAAASRSRPTRSPIQASRRRSGSPSPASRPRRSTNAASGRATLASGSSIDGWENAPLLEPRLRDADHDRRADLRPARPCGAARGGAARHRHFRAGDHASPRRVATRTRRGRSRTATSVG